MKASDFKTTRAVVIERPYEANLREIKLTEPKADAFVAKTLYSSISTGTDMKTYRGMQHPEQCYYPLVPGYETAGVIVAVPEEDTDFSRIPESARKLKVGDSAMDWNAILVAMQDFEGFALFEYENTEDIKEGLVKSYNYIKERTR